MSDFLSKFNKDKYDEFVNEQDDKANKNETDDNGKKKEQEQPAPALKRDEPAPEKEEASNPDSLFSRSSRRQDAEEEVEIDQDYQKKKRRRMWLIIGGAVAAFSVIFFIYYMLVHVEVEDFVSKPVSDARSWAKENDVEVELAQEYSMEQEANHVISQSVSAGDKIRKGKTLNLVSSLGPDPEEVVPLVDFSELSQVEAASWIEENKAENLQMVLEYSDDIEEGAFIQLNIKESGIDASEYRRRDSAAVYYSKGKEVFEKNISIPDFTGKPREEAEKWAETNEIEMTFKESDSASVEAGTIISQSEAAEGKIAKRDKMEVVVSLGEAIEVPNFGELTPEEAVANYPDLLLTVKHAYSVDFSYGRLISQSVEAGTKLTDKDDKKITVVYSEGSPYLRDFRGQLEGDLPRLFYEEYQSKGADIKYIVKYVDSPEVKGTVVGMGKFNEFVPMTHTVEIRVSNNASAPPNPTDFGEAPDDYIVGGGGSELPEEIDGIDEVPDK